MLISFLKHLIIYLIYRLSIIIKKIWISFKIRIGLKYYIVSEFHEQLESERFEELKESRITNIKKSQLKDCKKSSFEREEESFFIHQIAKELFNKHIIFITFKDTFHFDNNSISDRKMYEILSVDFRDDDNYLLIREINQQSTILFNGDLNHIFNYKNKPNNNYEFIRRGYFENYFNLIKHFGFVYSSGYKSNPFGTNKIEEELSKRIIQMPISEFVKHFNKIMFDKIEKPFKIINEPYEFNLKYTNTFVEIKFEGMLEVEINQIVPFPMSIHLESSMKNTLDTKYVFNGIDKTPLTIQYTSEFNNQDDIWIIFEISSEYPSSDLSKYVSIKTKSDNNVIMEGPKEQLVQYKRFDEINPKTYGKCELCGDKFDSVDEIYQIPDHENLYCHRSCYQYTRCCYCKRKPIDQFNDKLKLARELYIPEIKGFICDHCFYFTIFQHDKEKYGYDPLDQW